jgi:hypothetical protein
MPMGDWDRMKNYISDYLDDELDPTTHKQFENALKQSPELRLMTKKMSVLSSRMNKLTYHKCSDDFSLKLREKIHTTPQQMISRQNIVRYTFATSFVIILAVITFSLSDFSDSPEVVPSPQSNIELQNTNPNPVNNPLSNEGVNAFVKDGEVNLKTKTNQPAASDSLHEQDQHLEKNGDKPIKYVDQKK